MARPHQAGSYTPRHSPDGCPEAEDTDDDEDYLGSCTTDAGCTDDVDSGDCATLFEGTWDAEPCPEETEDESDSDLGRSVEQDRFDSSDEEDGRWKSDDDNDEGATARGFDSSFSSIEDDLYAAQFEDDEVGEDGP